MRTLTKTALAMRFMDMCDSVPLKEIRIKNFIEYADISKQTFYNYFQDKADLMNYVFELAAKKIIVDMTPSIQGMYYGASTMAYVCVDNRKFYMQLEKFETQNDFYQAFSLSVETVYRQKLLEALDMNTLDTQMSQVVHNFCIGICTFFVDWIRDGMKESPEYVGQTIIASMPTSIKVAFEKDNCF